MKKLFFVVLMIASAITSFAQMPPIPVDTDVRIGKLPNGLTYYIRHNNWPENRAEFYIAQRVGSIQEEDSQRGLAHFLEHMCFNGTKHFPGDGIIRYCESIGVKFGADLNAYTAIDETVYNISNVPTNNINNIIITTFVFINFLLFTILNLLIIIPPIKINVRFLICIIHEHLFLVKSFLQKNVCFCFQHISLKLQQKLSLNYTYRHIIYK